MPIITKPSLAKGDSVFFTLDKNALAALPEVSGDSIVAGPSAWSKVVVEFDSSESNQSKVVNFDPSVTTPEGLFYTSTFARGDFLVRKVTIYGPQGYKLEILRSSPNIDTNEFDVIFQLPGFSPTLKASSINLTNNNFTVDKIGVNSGVGFHHAYFSKGTNISGGGKYYWEYIATNVGFNEAMYVGFNIVNNEANITNFISGSTFNNSGVGVDAGWVQRTTANLNYRGEGLAIVSDSGTMPDSWTTGQRVMMALDADNSKIYVGINGSWGSADPVTNTGGLSIVITKNILYPGVILPGANDSSSFTIAETPLYLPSGFTHLK